MLPYCDKCKKKYEPEFGCDCKSSKEEPPSVSSSGEVTGCAEKCEWSMEENTDWWQSGCGEEWSFSGHYGPVSNGMRFCPFCGKELIEA